MKSFIITVEKFLKMDTEVEECNFSPEKRKLVIPLYQREFKWSDEKIVGLIGDISRRDKFLGNIILDEQADHYEIVDGQQRITTCFLTLLCLYNHYAGSPLEQDSIRRLLKPYESFLLINETVGEYVFEMDIYLSCRLVKQMMFIIKNVILNMHIILFLMKLQGLGNKVPCVNSKANSWIANY